LNGKIPGVTGFEAALVAIVLSEMARAAYMGLGVTREAVGNVLIDLSVTSLLAISVVAAFFTNAYLVRRHVHPMLAAVVAAVVVSIALAPMAVSAMVSLLRTRRGDSAPAVPEGLALTV
jgi:hypothetical protein